MLYDEIIPDQHKGNQLDTEDAAETSSVEEAQQLFSKARARLLHVNGWDQLCGLLSATFSLTDAAGNEVSRNAQEGDYFRIRIPAPGPSAGDGFDWAKVEAVDSAEDNYLDSNMVSVRVRPASSPVSDDPSTAHFFSDEATSTFMVERIHTRVVASVHGRNERANTDTEKATDAVRNTVVATGAVSGFSKLQWNKLVKGLIATND